MKTFTTTVLLFLLLLGTVACSNELSRSKAAALINQAYKLPQPEPLAILKSYSKRSWSDPSWMPAVCMVTGPKYSEAGETLNALTSKRLVTVAESTTKRGECNYVWADVRDRAVTEASRSARAVREGRIAGSFRPGLSGNPKNRTPGTRKAPTPGPSSMPFANYSRPRLSRLDPTTPLTRMVSIRRRV